MTVGPIEYMLVTGNDDRLGPAAEAEIQNLLDAGTIRILDMAMIRKNGDGTVTLAEYDDASGSADIAVLDTEVGGLISQEDADYLGEALEPGSSAVLLVWEDPWAQPLFDALQASGAVLVEGGRVPDDLAVAAMDALASS
jgi:Family of unknown function (DUF6325)